MTDIRLKPFYALFIIFNLVGQCLLAKQQNPAIDSLKKLVRPALNASTTTDTLTISRLDKIADKYYESFPDSTAYYGNLEIKLSKKINYLKGVADGSCQIASVNAFRGDYAASNKNYTLALNLYKKIGYHHGITLSYIGLGSAQDYLGNYDEAIRLYNMALALSIKTHNEGDEANCLNVLGITYDNKGEFSKALDYYFKSLIIDIKNKDALSAADEYCNIGVVMQHFELYPKALNYFNLALNYWQKTNDTQGISTATQNIGEVLLSQKKYKEAIIYLNKASRIFHEMDDREGLSLIYYDLGLYNYYTNHTAEAIRYLNLSLESAEKNKIKYNKANAYIGLALVYNLEKDYKRAYDYATKAQLTANNLGSLSVKVDAILQMTKALAGLKQFEQAYHQHEIYADLKSDLKHNESIQKIVSYNLEIDFAKKQKDLEDKQSLKDTVYQQKIAQQKNASLVYAFIIAITATMAVIYYRGKRKQQKINALLEEKNKEVILQQENLNLQALKLNDLNLLKDRLIGVLAHDLRAPISTLRGLFTLMTDDSITHEEFVEMTPRVFNTLEHTSDFLDTLLFWINSQVDSNESAIKSFAINDIIKRELIHLEDKFKHKDIDTHINIAPNTMALADPNSIRIVIHNFLTNAIKFSNRGGTIEISCYSVNNDIIDFCVKDYGIGMNEQYLNNLFKSQVTSLTGTENESGTGMGLLFCKDLIEKNHGKIWAKSTLGAGTELCFTLPKGSENFN